MFDFLKSGSAKIQAEIDAESLRAQEAAATEARLKDGRADALLAGDTKELDRIDAQLVASSRDASRRTERVQLLRQKLDQTQEREKTQEMDAVVARTERARKLGEDLIRKEYAKQAAALAVTLLKLRAIDEFIAHQNRLIDRAGREVVGSPNAIRHVAGRSEMRTVRKTVGIGEARHPHHEDWRKTDHRGAISGTQPENVTLRNGNSVPRYMEVEYEEPYHSSPIWADPLHAAIAQLPSATNDESPLYKADARDEDFFDKLQKLQKELDL